MDFGWSEEDLAFREAILAFGRGELSADLIDRDQAGRFAREWWKKCGEFGILGLPFPEALGGGGRDPLTAVMALEALGRACGDNGLLFGLAAQIWSVQMPIWRFGTETQQQRYLPLLCRGEWIGAHAMSEPDSGSDAFSLQTRADPVDGGYLLNGVKTFVTSAPEADLFVVFASTSREKGVLGLTGFLLERGQPGLRIGREIRKMGLRTSPMAEVILEDCRVPESARLGREGRGSAVFNDSMEWERAGILAGPVGAMERQLEETVAYARERRQFGSPIGDFQAIQHRIADMKARLDSARLLLYRAVWAKQQAEGAALAASVAKLTISEAWVQSSLDALRIRGGYGYTVEYQVERDLRDAIGSTLYSGTSDIQRNLIARGLGL